jgi:FkbM family methyltransferase
LKDHSEEIATYLDAVKQRERRHIDDVFDNLRHAKHVCVFGAGMTSETVVALLRKLTDIKVDFLCDNDPAKWGRIFSGDLVCHSPDELERYRDDVAIVIATKHCKEVHAQLRARGFQRMVAIPIFFIGENHDFFADRENIEVIKRNVLRLLALLADDRSREIVQQLLRIWFDFDIEMPGYAGICSDDEYYPAGVIELGEREAFVDGGAYDGDSLLRFLENSRGRFDAVYCFELDATNFRLLQQTVAKLDPDQQRKIELHNLGLYDEAKQISYETGNTKGQNSRICDGASNSGQVVRLADVLNDRKVTFIKMDLEGADLRALRGAEAIIRRHRPKLAICVYHKLQHLWEVPFYMVSLCPDYRLYLRHHSTLEYGTVCYAVAR